MKRTLTSRVALGVLAFGGCDSSVTNGSSSDDDDDATPGVPAGWTVVQSGTTQMLLAVAGSGSDIVAVGWFGTIVR